MSSDKSMIRSIREMLRGCPFLSDFSRGYISYIDSEDPSNYGIFPTGEVLLWEDMAGNSKWQYNFALQAVNFTPEDSLRLANSEFVERLCRWFFEQSRQVSGFDVDVVSITAQNGQFVDISENGNCGTYQVPCTLIYEKER